MCSQCTEPPPTVYSYTKPPCTGRVCCGIRYQYEKELGVLPAFVCTRLVRYGTVRVVRSSRRFCSVRLTGTHSDSHLAMASKRCQLRTTMCAWDQRKFDPPYTHKPNHSINAGSFFHGSRTRLHYQPLGASLLVLVPYSLVTITSIVCQKQSL